MFACRSATVHEEALLAVGSVTYASGKQFIKYMESFSPILVQGLTNHQVRGYRPSAAAVVILAACMPDSDNEHLADDVHAMNE